AVLLPHLSDRASLPGWDLARARLRGDRRARTRARRRRPMSADPIDVNGPPLRVLHLAANRWWTGSADPIIQLVGGLRRRGHHVLLGVTPGDRFEANAREAGVPLVGGLSLRGRVSPVGLLRDVARLRALVKHER